MISFALRELAPQCLAGAGRRADFAQIFAGFRKQYR